MAAQSRAAPPAASLLGLPNELLAQITSYLEPQLEPQLSRTFRPIANGFPQNPLTVVRQCPRRRNLQNGDEPGWDAYKDLTSMQLTCRELAIRVNFYRVVMICTGTQLALFFLRILQNPHRSAQVDELQIHQLCLIPEEAEACAEALKWINAETGWDILGIAADIYRKAGYGRASPRQNSSTAVLSLVLVRLLPNVRRLFLPYPSSLMHSSFSLKHLDLASSLINTPRPQYTSPAPRHNPARSPALMRPLYAVSPVHLRHFQLNGVAHSQARHLSRNMMLYHQKPNDPVQFWTILCSSAAFQGLVSLDLQRIGDPMPSQFSSTLILPRLKTLRLHSINMDEDDLLRMLPAVPALEILEVWFTIKSRTPEQSIDKQERLDSSFAAFPPGLKSLTLAYLADVRPLPRIAVGHVVMHKWTPTMRLRRRMRSLDKLAHVEKLTIDIMSILPLEWSFNSRLMPLPPKLKHLRVLSATSISPEEFAWEMHFFNDIPLAVQGPQHYDQTPPPFKPTNPLEWDHESYIDALAAFQVCLQHYCDENPEMRGVLRVDLIRPLYCDEALHNAILDSHVRQSLAWNWKSIYIAKSIEETLPELMKQVADTIRVYSGIEVNVAFTWEDQMGGDRVTTRDTPYFWM